MISIYFQIYRIFIVHIEAISASAKEKVMLAGRRGQTLVKGQEWWTKAEIQPISSNIEIIEVHKSRSLNQMKSAIVSASSLSKCMRSQFRYCQFEFPDLFYYILIRKNIISELILAQSVHTCLYINHIASIHLCISNSLDSNTSLLVNISF